MIVRRPNLFIVGAPRCGTSGMHAYLGRHPQVYMSPVKEPHFFSEHLFLPDRYAAPPITDEAAYLALFANATQQRHLGEASPSYLYSAAASDAISRFAADPRIVIMVRNPVDLMYSLYSLTSMAAIHNGDPPMPVFEAMVDGDVNRGRHARLGYQDLACVANGVEGYIRVFGRERVHVVVFDDLKERTTDTQRRVAEFLGIDPAAAPLEPVPDDQRMPSRWVRSTALGRWLAQPTPGIRVVARAVLPPIVRRSVTRVLRALNRTRPPGLDPAVRRRLAARFEDEVQHLGDLLQRDLRHWHH